MCYDPLRFILSFSDLFIHSLAITYEIKDQSFLTSFLSVFPFPFMSFSLPFLSSFLALFSFWLPYLLACFVVPFLLSPSVLSFILSSLCSFRLSLPSLFFPACFLPFALRAPSSCCFSCFLDFLLFFFLFLVPLSCFLDSLLSTSCLSFFLFFSLLFLPSCYLLFFRFVLVFASLLSFLFSPLFRLHFAVSYFSPIPFLSCLLPSFHDSSSFSLSCFLLLSFSFLFVVLLPLLSTPFLSLSLAFLIPSFLPLACLPFFSSLLFFLLFLPS